ncbi:MAG TPA: ATP-binding cassette domain-containing protein [Acetobacteraceae bacterium]|jgi:ATP-binding cassette subfamily F protein uup|nr:ATP-binding cassette domain-containing protein [Acetobacteraceae bacterium]
MPPPLLLLLLQNINLTFGTAPILAGAGLAVAAGDRVCLVGRNGSGKSTLLRIAAGLVQSDAGRRFAQPGATIRYLPQEPDFSGFATTLAYVEAGLVSDADADHHRARYLLEQLGLSGEKHPATLSGGEARRVALARTLAPAPDILLLDEPTNHLDLPGIEWLERELAAMRAGIVVVSHDRRLLERLSRTTVWLDRGITRTLDQGFSGFESWRDSVLEQEEVDRHKLGRKIAMEEDWLRYGVTARRKRNQKRLADLHALRKRRKEQRAAPGKVRLEAAGADLSGRLVMVADGVTKSFGDRTIVREFSTRILRGDRVGLVGANGAGKTTLLNLLTGALPPDAGEVRLGTSLAQVTLDQRRDTLDPVQTLSQALTDGHGDTVTVGGRVRHVASYMKDFLFGPEQANTPVGVLSGGERGRLTLARAFARPSNLLVLDEPTNDLDLETLDLLQERLADYSGTVLLVSHDRDFLDRVVTSVIAAEGDGRWVEYAGGYSDMLAQRGPRVAPSRAAQAAVARPRPAMPQPVAEMGPQQVARPRRMTFKDRHALETLPARIAALQAETARLSTALADPDFYARDPGRFAATTAALAAAQEALAAAEEQWLALEMLREEIGG